MYDLETQTEFKVSNTPGDGWLIAGTSGLVGWGGVSCVWHYKGKHLDDERTGVLFIQRFGCCAGTG